MGDIGSSIASGPARTALHPNVPNPFNPTTLIRFDLGAAGPVRLCIYDVAGRLVRTLLDGERQRDWYRITWDGLDARGRRVASGIYHCRLVTRDHDASRKLVVLQ